MTTVTCQVCQRTQRVNVSDCIRNGWPICHAMVMTVTGNLDADVIDNAIADAFRSLNRARGIAARIAADDHHRRQL
jgi:hypothetical protein